MISLLQIAPTLAEYFNVPLSSPARPVEQILAFVYSRYTLPPVVALLVIDSLDFWLYSEFAGELRCLHELAQGQKGLIFECETVSSHTTPAIGSILSGLEPRVHGIFSNNDVGKSKIKSILEILEDDKKKTAIVIETGGAKPLLGRISHVCTVDDREDIIEYDELIKRYTIAVLKKPELKMVFSH
ncbi:MAG: alkaline phosphatase family protein, partial [Halobacteriota archaeon]